MYEAYQHIMKAQVEFLIGVGVNPALKVPSEFFLIVLPEYVLYIFRSLEDSVKFSPLPLESLIRILFTWLSGLVENKEVSEANTLQDAGYVFIVIW